MSVLAKNKWLSLSLLAIILPISVLTTLKFSGFLTQPQPETITVNAVSWNMERPSESIQIVENIKSTHTDEVIFASLRILVTTFDSGSWAGFDDLGLKIYFNATVVEGSVDSVSIYFCEEGNSSYVSLDGLREFKNLKVIGKINDGDTLRSNYVKAYIEAIGIDYPKDVNMSLFFGGPFWVFLDDRNMNHTLEVIVELIHRTSTTYRKVVMPIHLGVSLDAGNTFETARVIVPGSYNGHVDPTSDCDDFYALSVEAGQTIYVEMTPPYELDFDLYLYDPSRKLEVLSCTRGNGLTEQITFKTNSTGIWFIQVRSFSNYSRNGLYFLKVVVSNGEDGGNH
jgi:hypothetical protein